MLLSTAARRNPTEASAHSELADEQWLAPGLTWDQRMTRAIMGDPGLRGHAIVSKWPESAVPEGAEQVRSAQVLQTSTRFRKCVVDFDSEISDCTLDPMASEP
jgi:hypothetical protein